MNIHNRSTEPDSLLCTILIPLLNIFQPKRSNFFLHPYPYKALLLCLGSFFYFLLPPLERMVWHVDKTVHTPERESGICALWAFSLAWKMLELTTSFNRLTGYIVASFIRRETFYDIAGCKMSDLVRIFFHKLYLYSHPSQECLVGLKIIQYQRRWFQYQGLICLGRWHSKGARTTLLGLVEKCSCIRPVWSQQRTILSLGLSVKADIGVKQPTSTVTRKLCPWGYISVV